MVKRQELDNVIMTILAIVGIGFLGISTSAFTNIKKTCTDKLIQNGWTVIMVLGVCLTTASASYFICTKSNGANCYDDEDKNITMFLILSAIMAGAILIISSMMMSSLNKGTVKSACNENDNIKKLSGVALGLSLITLVSCGVVIGLTYIDINK